MSSEKTHLIGENDTTTNGFINEACDAKVTYNTDGQRNNSAYYPTDFTTEQRFSDGSKSPGYLELSESRTSLSHSVETKEETGRITSFQAFVHIVRCHAGSGILGAAKAVDNAGLLVGMILYITCGLLVLSGMHLILNSARLLGERLSDDHTVWTYQDVVEKSFIHGSPRVTMFAGVGRSASILFAALLQFGVCAFFFVVVGDITRQLVRDFTQVDLDVRVYMTVMLVILIIPACIRRLDILAIFSTIGNIFFVVCMLITIGYVVMDLPPIWIRPAFNSFTTLPLFFGQALMTLEGIAVVIPIQNKMKNPEYFASCPGVLNVGIAFIICLMTAIGCLGYWKYGPDTATNILLNLPHEEWLCVAAKIMLPICLICTYPIQFYFIFVMIWQPVADRLTSPWLLNHGESIQRMVILILTFACAAFIPHLDLLMSLYGSVCSTFLGFIIPAIVDIVVRTGDNGHITVLPLIRDIIFIVIGFLAFGTGTYSAVRDIIATF